LRFFHDTEGFSRLIELYYSVSLRIPDPVSKNRCPGLSGPGKLKLSGQTLAVKYVIAQNHADVIGSDKVPADDERLGEPFRSWLLCVAKGYAPLGTVSEKLFEQGQVVRGRDDKNVFNARQHQNGERKINHGLVIYGQELFADHTGDRI